MTDQERAQVLKMIEEGKVTPEEGLRLMQTLEQNPADDTGAATGSPASSASASGAAEAGTRDRASGSGEGAGRPDADMPRIHRVAEKGRRLWYIPLAVGILITVLGGFILYWNMHPTGISVWFYCLGLPVLLLGVAITALGAASRTARWLFVNIEQKPGKSLEHIVLGFPLPLGLSAWFLRNFGHYIPGLEKTAADEIIVALDQVTSTDTPLVVDVDDGEDGDKVQVFIG